MKLFARLVRRSRANHFVLATQPSEAGFTLLELLTIVVIMGILTAIAGSSWLAFFNTRKLNVAQDTVYQAMRQAQTEAKRFRLKRQVSFREVNGVVQWTTSSNTSPTAAQWQSFSTGIRIDPQETTLLLSGGVYSVQFDHKGNISGQLGKLTLTGASGSTRRCVITSTLIGIIRKAGENSTPDQTGRFCY